MPRQRFTFTHRMWIPGVVLALLMTSLLFVSDLLTGESAVAAVSPGVTVRASVAGNETQGDDSSDHPAISADGRYVAFDSTYPFDPFDGGNDTGGRESDVYVRDTVAGTTTLISHGRAEPPSRPRIAMLGGAVMAAELTAREPGAGPSALPSISADGRYLAFSTTATNIPVGGFGDRARVVVCDRDPDGDGAFASECVDTLVSRDGIPEGAVEGHPRMSAAAALAVYQSRTPASAGNRPKLVAVTLGRGPAGAISFPQPTDFTDIFPPDSIVDGTFSYLLDTIDGFALSAGGSHVGVTTTYRRSSGGLLSFVHRVYDYDVASRTFVRMDVDGAGRALPDDSRHDLALSGDGRRLAFVEFSAATGPVVRLYDRDPDADGVWFPAAGEPLTTEIGSRNRTGEEVRGTQPAFSADGRYLAFVTDAHDVHNGVDDLTFSSCLFQIGTLAAYEAPDNATDAVPVAARAPGLFDISSCDVVVRDLVTDRQRELARLPRLPAELASPSRLTDCLAFTPGATCEGGADSTGPVLTANGSAVAYDSWAPDLVPGDTNVESDVFVRRFTPTLRAEPVDFGTVELGLSAIRAVPVRQVGFGPLTAGPVAISGPNAGDFTIFPSQNCTGAILHATEQCVISVQFRPTAATVRTAVLQVRPAGAPQPVAAALTGLGQEPPPGFRATPNPLAFGSRGVLNRSPVQTITVTNTGRGPVRLGPVTLTGTAPTGFPGDYEITVNTCLDATVPIGGSCQVSVRHVPKAIGVRPAVVQFVEGSDPVVFHRVDLTGTGLAPTIVVTPPLAPPGQVVRVTGTNFPPGSTVGLTLDGMPGQTKVLVTGNGTLSTQFLVLPHTATGKRPLRAVVIPPLPTGLTGPVQASTEFLVVPGSLQPPDFTVRK